MKRFFSLLVLLSAWTSLVQAQITFSKEYGGFYDEDGRWMEQTSDSGFVMVGGTETYSNGQSDIWLVRTDAYGNVLWNRSYGDTQFDFANMVRITSDGGFVIAGFTGSFGAVNNDGWIIKTDGSGNIQWTRMIGDNGIQEIEAIIQTTDGGYAALGYNQSTGTQWYDMWLIRLNANGTVRWQKNIGGQGYEIGNSLQQTPDGGFILNGQSYSYGLEDGDYVLYKTDSAGTVQWYKNYDFAGLQESHHVCYTPADGGFLMVGDADDTPNGLGDTDIFLIKTDANGDTLWTKNLGGTKKDGGKTVEVTSDGGYIIGGITRSFGLINPNYYLGKLDASGNLEWENVTYGSAYHDHAYRAIETSDGGYANFGYFRNASNYQNYALVKLGPGGGVTKDVAIDNYNYPLTSLCRSAGVPISLKLTNYGATNETNIPVVVVIDNGSQQWTLHDTLTTALAPSNSATLLFDQTFDFTTVGTWNLTAYIPHRNSDISYSNDTSYLTVEVVLPSQDPNTTSAVSCNAGSVNLRASALAATDSLFWYDASTGGNLVGTGTSYTTPSLSSTTDYFVEAVRGKGSKVGPVDNTIGGGGSSSNGELRFDSRTNFKLVSVKVYASSAGNRIIELRNGAGNLLQSKTINLPVGESRVYLNFDVPQENDLTLGLGAGSLGLFRNNSGVSYPYDVSRTLEIYGSNSGPNFYYYFYDWYVFVPYQNCASNRVTASAQIGSGASNAFDRSRCGNGSVTLSANSPDALTWWDAASGGTQVGSGSSYSTPGLSSTTSYYLQAGSCPSRIEVQAIINAQSSAPTASDVTNCGPGAVTLTASSPDPISWYNLASNGFLLGSGSSYITPYLTETDTFYAVAGTACPSSAVAVRAIINSAAAPTGTDASACGPASVTLSATSTDPIEWYDAAIGGNLVGTGPTLVTPVLGATTTYYAQAVGGCASVRTPVTANITVVSPPVGTSASRCGSGTLVISAASIDPVTWWDAASGGTQIGSGINFTTPVLTSTTTYYAEAANNGCSSTRTAVDAEIIVTPPPTVTSGSVCISGSVILTASSTDSIAWYDAPTGGNLLGTGSSFTTPVINSTTTYYVEAGLSCPSVRVPVDAIVAGPSSTPTVTGASNCGSGSVTLTASSPDPISWYDAPSGGTLLGTGASFTTPVISTTTTYYAIAGITGCESAPASVDAEILPLAADPVTTGASNCGPGSLTLNATAADPMSWYDAPSNGTLIATGTSYTSTFSATTTYYVIANNGTCPSNPVPVTATINTLPVVSLGPDTVNILSGQTVTLDAGAVFSSYLWSTTATTQTINTGVSGVYSVTVTDGNGCTGSDSIVVNIITGLNAISGDIQLNIFPNPSNGRVEVTAVGVSESFELRITDQLGRVIFFEPVRQTNIYRKSIDLSEKAQGVYFLQLSTSKGRVTRALIIE